MHEPIGPASQHPLIEFGMTRRAHDEQVGLELRCQFDDIANRMPSDNVSMDSNVAVSCHFARTLQYSMVTTSRGSDFFPDLFDEFWK